MTLRIVYRSYGGENLKGRPIFYSKLLALASFVRAVKQLGPIRSETIYLNDGPIPTERLQIMLRTGEVIQGSKMGNRGSIATALKLPNKRAWSSDDLLWLAEDDYLYRPDALISLMQAANHFSSADYFSFYALVGSRLPNGEKPDDQRVPADWSAGLPVNLDGHIWQKALSTTSTFGVRIAALNVDRRMMVAAMRCGGAFDHSTCLVYQGFVPYPLWFLWQGVRSGEGRRIKAVGAALVRSAFNFYATLRRPWHSPRLLVASDPALATHMERDYLASGCEWMNVARETNAWLANGGLEETMA